MKKRIFIINGPNMNLLGERQKKIYGKKSLKDIKKIIKKEFSSHFKISFFQSNCEGKIVNKIQNSDFDYYIINMAGFSYNSVAILDAITSKERKIIEVHMSNIFKREKFRSKSIFSKYSIGVITGFGYMSYVLALKYLKNLYQ
ncbi:3-dehydroquinate dehydratase II [Candidatus Vidania fulgoroideae]|nr:3-dehydroquinate dehydratase II [Candidatus Vidania fulgoroideae]